MNHVHHFPPGILACPIPDPSDFDYSSFLQQADEIAFPDPSPTTAPLLPLFLNRRPVKQLPHALMDAATATVNFAAYTAPTHRGSRDWRGGPIPRADAAVLTARGGASRWAFLPGAGIEAILKPATALRGNLSRLSITSN
ncbi:hypothetical protein C2857_004405 [Epichloe festucae Fl1]|uniref:Uncharacterized protein n=1 Tax=Epichloe festucae (strain Fl1) TaxID=877507 RepID=A0A7S9PWS5_EPIFF|nr:hypothetical protein C2857_004405 [Epichloe festucae Fl1]